MATLHVEAERSLNFLGDENDDLNASCRDTKQVISRLSTRLSQLSQKVELFAKEIDESREYSYSFNVKFLGIPELKPRESGMEATELCVHIFNAIGNTDIAHRVAPRDATGGRPEPVAEPITCKFIRRLAREEVMALCRENKKCGYRWYRPASESALTNAGTYEHLTQNVNNCWMMLNRLNIVITSPWTRNSVIWLQQQQTPAQSRLKTRAIWGS